MCHSHIQSTSSGSDTRLQPVDSSSHVYKDKGTASPFAGWVQGRMASSSTVSRFNPRLREMKPGPCRTDQSSMFARHSTLGRAAASLDTFRNLCLGSAAAVKHTQPRSGPKPSINSQLGFHKLYAFRARTCEAIGVSFSTPDSGLSPLSASLLIGYWPLAWVLPRSFHGYRQKTDLHSVDTAVAPGGVVANS